MEGRCPHRYVAVHPRNRHLGNPVPHHEWLESSLGVDGEAGLPELQFLNDLAAHQLQIVREVTKPLAQDDLGKRMKAAIGHDLLKRIVQEDAVPRESASDDDVV